MVRNTTKTALLALFSATALGSTAGDVKVDSRGSIMPAGFSRCLFYDDFSQTPGGLPDSSKWQIDLGTRYANGGPKNWGTGEIQVYTDHTQNVHITHDQTLKITPVRSNNGTWTSARIETTADWDFACPEGERMRVEARLKLGGQAKKNALGIWPAFWLLGSGYRNNYSAWPAVGEIDIMESANGLDKMWHTIHCGKYPGGVCNEPNGIGHPTKDVPRSSWHTLALDVDRRHPAGHGKQSMSWLIDGVTRWTVHESNLTSPGNNTAAQAWNALVANPKMLLFNVAVGGALPNAFSGIDTPTNATQGGDGASMEVDYAAVYLTSTGLALPL
ncbi:hypothetical protein E4U32_002158 [Claviceps aff. humidiphila group G2b]|nr:hypothetical protein E4U32_002158 [Claviceps aff. humidiphila group G2b]